MVLTRGRVPASSPQTLPKPKPSPAAGELSWRLVRRDGRPAGVVAFEESLIGFFLESATLLGVPKSLAAIYGVCFASPEPLSYSEVKERLNISAGSISQGLRILHEVGALKSVTSGIDRRELFTPDMELRRLVAHYLKERVEKQLDAGCGRLKGIAKAIPSDEDGAAKVLRARLKSLQGWHDKSRAALPAIKVLLKLAG